jgi:ribosomal protein S18 acetylase RimI-like enzyme
MKAFFLYATLAIMAGGHSHVSAVIRPYDRTRDFSPVNKIIEDHKDYLYAQKNGKPFKNAIAGFTEGNTAVFENEQRKTVGFIEYERDLGPFSLINNGHINYLGVDKKYQGKGYGKTLFKYAVHDLEEQGVKRITLSVKENNEAARKLYEKSGFRVCYTAPTGNLLYEKKCNQGSFFVEGAKFVLSASLIGGIIVARNMSCADMWDLCSRFTS